MVRFIFNPGTGVAEGANEQNAIDNMPQFIQDVGVEQVLVGRLPKSDDGIGRYGFLLIKGGVKVEMQMPGLPLEQVRFLDKEDQDIWDFPRLYINGESWVWEFAISEARAYLSGEQS